MKKIQPDISQITRGLSQEKNLVMMTSTQLIARGAWKEGGLRGS